MKLKDHITRIQQKPEHQRERIAVIATAVSFLIVLAIWLVTFSEMNKSTQPGENSQATEQLNDLKSSAGEGKKSIEEMWSQMPTQEDMTNINEELNSSEYNLDGSEINQNSQGDGTGGENSAQSSEIAPLDRNESQSGEIPPLP